MSARPLFDSWPPGGSPGKRLKKRLPDSLRPWLRLILETVLPGSSNQQNHDDACFNRPHRLKNHKKLRVHKL
jgi:hypothetical protein